ncbi:hypothetical protein JVU11DRAFT_2449 [Chiua virens]|nr:hypothetical protein JVU11DRAFT_2449 [Chiua virens]
MDQPRNLDPFPGTYALRDLPRNLPLTLPAREVQFPVVSWKGCVRLAFLLVLNSTRSTGRIPDTIEESPIVPHAIPPVFVNVILDNGDDLEEEYGIPLSSPKLHSTPDHSSPSSHLPFNINVPPPSEDVLAETRATAAWSIATPSTPQLLGSPRIRPALGGAETDAEEARETHQRPRRLHFPSNINISTISSHAQAEELVQRTQQSILNMEQYLEKDSQKGSETGRTPLSAKLAAYGESLAIERRLKEMVTAQTPEPNVDAGHSNGGVSLLSTTKPSHIRPLPHSSHDALLNGKISQQLTSEHPYQTTWTPSYDDSPAFESGPLDSSMQNSPYSRSQTPDPDPDFSYDSTPARRGRERDPSRSFQKLSRMGFSTFDNWHPSPAKGRASRSPPPSLRFGLRTIMQSFQGK